MTWLLEAVTYHIGIALIFALGIAFISYLGYWSSESPVPRIWKGLSKGQIVGVALYASMPLQLWLLHFIGSWRTPPVTCVECLAAEIGICLPHIIEQFERSQPIWPRIVGLVWVGAIVYAQPFIDRHHLKEAKQAQACQLNLLKETEGDVPVMKLNLESIQNFPSSYQLPQYDVAAMVAKTKAAPVWLHMGAGNIFRILVAGAQQTILDQGLTDTGIVVYEAFDEEIVPKAFAPYANLTLAVTLFADGSAKKRVIASIADSFTCDLPRLRETIANPSMQMVSFTITEKGYTVDASRVSQSPDTAITAIEQVTAALLCRHKAGAPPIALVSMDNFAENGTHLENAVTTVAQTWIKNGQAPTSFMAYVGTLSFPWTMVDKITPRPSEDVAKMLEADGITDTAITKTTKNTFVAPFVNAESAEYLIIEDKFPNGRPPLEKAGVYLTDRETVRKMDQMKVCACLNPLHTVLAISGMLLDKPTIASCMQDPALVRLVHATAAEALPTVVNPGIIDPKVFLEEVLTERFPNPFIPDAPARIACDTSQKVPVRFGVTLQEREKEGLPIDVLEAIPTFIALWLRYRTGVADSGQALELSPDPGLPEVFNALTGVAFGATVDLKPMLSCAQTFGVDLYQVGLGEKIEKLFATFNAAAGAVAAYLSAQ